jgi:Spy/CpxP family protein refolding chaperone
MSDAVNTHAPAPNPQPRSRGRRITWIAVAALAVGLTVGAASTTALSRGGFGPGGWHGHGFMGRGFDPAQAEARADRMVRHLAVELDATNEQQDKLRTVVKNAVKDVLPMREKVQTAREQARKLLTEPTVNRSEIEKLRAEHVALADTFSRRIAQALTDAAEILTPEQRRKLNDLLPAGGPMGRGMHSMDGPMGGHGPMGGPGRGWNR